ncbi:MAG: hypothetical protein H5T69_13100 [Chloroflexi bacterium]|nr:hypothetical protein [Chloroflexota bacterium]
MRSAQTGFTAERGFRFDNRFVLPFSKGRVVYGLCGGLCFGALDYYYAGRPIPAQTVPPRFGSPLYRFLVRRQLDSLGRLVLPRVVRWMAASDERAAAWTASSELPRLLSALDRGRPAVLVIMRVGGLANPTYNHQVVAFGYVQDERGMCSFAVYDPNHPGEPATITLESRGTSVRLWQAEGETVRGFWVQDYRPVTGALPD